ncbi:DUF6638 family protein [Neotamlana laminarinivorans]|uniref:Uncharacterized protein n=1 Tax=Neotamlana laminarinivorans TaxID=2883124 RepID=A0A9X1HWS2_9FLAO|nr:DUF6638 family protein [Tamlana laminarinivorans]MCB4797599.1 hypothetical protein [Tamlana laminarinivorans]
MNKLKQANLYRSELIPVSGKLVDRYNKGLVKLGFTETKLKTFSIDGIGWSPEIAEEKNDLNYLNNGEANPHGILISPQQKGKPVYLPFHTFDKEVMKYVFRVHGDKIKDITRDSALCLDFDQGIDAFYEPLDVLKYDKIKVHFHFVDDLNKIQKEQLELVEVFKRDNNFIDESIHKKLLASAKAYGDLRNRNLNLHVLEHQTNSFYTRAFGGVYVLRDFISPIVIFEDEKWHKEAIKDTNYDVLIYHIKQPELMDKLRDHMIIECNLEEVVKTKRYERIKLFKMAQVLKETQHPLYDILTNSILTKSYLNKLTIDDRKRLMSVERYLEKLEVSNQFKRADIVDDALFEALHKPHSSLQASHQDLIWQLLVNVTPKDVLFWYWYDKPAFYKAFETWDDSFKDWVIETISNNIE